MADCCRQTKGNVTINYQYTKDISSTQLNEAIKVIGTTPNIRLKTLEDLSM